MSLSKIKNLLASLTACAIIATSTLGAPTFALAADTNAGEVATQRLVTADVLDTYKSFSTANYPSENIDCYAQTYKRLSFKTSYARTGQTILYTSVALSPRGNGMPGFETKYQCTYRTW